MLLLAPTILSKVEHGPGNGDRERWEDREHSAWHLSLLTAPATHLHGNYTASLHVFDYRTNAILSYIKSLVVSSPLWQPRAGLSRMRVTRIVVLQYLLGIYIRN